MTFHSSPKSWRKVSLSDCCKIISGATPRRDCPEYWGGTIPWVTPKDLSKLEGTTIDDAPEYITEKGYRNCSTDLLPKGAVLFSSRAPIGHVAIAGRPMCTNQGFKSLIPSDELTSSYLYWCLRKMVPEISARGTGTTFKEVSKAVMEEFEIPLPPLPEQKRIAAILDKADSIRRKRQEAVRLTEELLRSVFLDMFGDPVKNPKGWETRAFVEVCETRLGKMLDANQQTGEHLRQYLRNSNVQWDRIETSDLEQMDFNEKDRKTFSLKDGDVLICEGGEVGRAAIWRNQMADCYFQKAIHRARPNQSLAVPEYVMFWLWFMSKNGGFKDHVTSATIAHLTGQKLKEIQMV